MKITLTEQGFRNEWYGCSRADSFTDPALDAIFADIEEREQWGEEYELDYIEIDSTYCQYDTEESALNDGVDITDIFAYFNDDSVLAYSN